MRTTDFLLVLKSDSLPWKGRVYTTKPPSVRLPLVLVYPLSRIPFAAYAKPVVNEFFDKAQFQVELYTENEDSASESAMIGKLATLHGVVNVSNAVYIHDSDVLRTLYTVTTTGG